MAGRTREIAGAQVPTFLYGTAWKEDSTAGLVAQALRAGFRGVDTANQRRHYREADVGRALLAAFTEGVVRREDLFVRTKFTFRAGRDPFRSRHLSYRGRLPPQGHAHAHVCRDPHEDP